MPQAPAARPSFLNKEVCTLTLLAQLSPFFLTLLAFVGYLVTAMRRVTNVRTCRKLGHISVASQWSGSVTEEGQENHNVTVTPRRKCDINQGRENTSQDLLRVTVYRDISAMVGNSSAFLMNVKLRVVLQSGH